MDATALLRVLLRVEGAAFAVALAALFGHAAWLRARTARTAPLLERGRAVLYQVATEDRVDDAGLAVLRALPPRLQTRLFVELTLSLGGSHRATFAALARDAGLEQRARALCRSGRWWRRLRGVRLLAAVGGGEDTVPALFADPHPAVRAEAVEWAAEHPTEAIVAGLVELLALPRDAARFALLDSLMRIGARVVEPLAAYLETHAGQQAVPALQVAAAVPHARFSAAALRLCGDPVAEVRACAAALLGRIGGNEAVDALDALLADGDAEVRAAAAGALGGLGHWPAAPAVARLLRDPAWAVRRAAGLSLRALGSPGQLLLRRALDDGDRFAAEMARQVLDRPGPAVERGIR